MATTNKLLTPGAAATDSERLPRKSLVLAVMSLSTFMIFLDATVVNTALPAIARDFAASNTVLVWVVNAYSLILAGFLLVGGTTGDRFGRRRAFAAGMVLFGLASAGAAVSSSSTQLIAMRGLQGLGAAFVLPATLSIITDVFPRGERARAIAIWTAVGSIGIAVGPALSGLLVDNVDWSAVFWLHIPVVVLALVGTTAVPESRDERNLPLDIPGALLATVGLLGVTFGIIQGGEDGWTSPQILAAFSIGAIALSTFVVVELRSAHPMLPLGYFKQKDFSGPFAVLVLMFMGMVGVFFFLTQFYQLVQGRSALAAGLALAPVAAGMMIGAGFASKAVPRVGPRAVFVIGGSIVVAGMGFFIGLDVDTPYWVPAVGITLFGLGAGMNMPAATDTIMAAVPVNDAGIGAAMNDLSRELGLALGVAALGALVTTSYRSDVADATEGIVAPEIAEVVGDSLGAVEVVTQELPSALATQISDAANTAFVDALGVGYVAAASLVAVAILVAAFAVPRRMRTDQADEVVDEAVEVPALDPAA